MSEINFNKRWFESITDHVANLPIKYIAIRSNQSKLTDRLARGRGIMMIEISIGGNRGCLTGIYRMNKFVVSGDDLDRIGRFRSMKEEIK